MIMVGLSFYRALTASEEVSIESRILIGIIVLSYLLPLILNQSTIKTSTFLKGLFSLIYLSPTYVNIISIYAISNIDDISWGTRASNAVNNITQKEKKTKEEYQDYKAWFLVIWSLVNLSVGLAMVEISRNQEYYLVHIVAFFLGIIIGFKLFFSTLHTLYSKN